MALLRNLEHSLSGLVEGTVGRVFRTEVRPTEIARKLAREMEINKRVSLSRTYAPTDYLVYLSPEDRARYTGVEESIADELGAYLLEHARRERLVLVRRPLVVFRTDQRLRLGEFGIEARTAPISAEEAPPRPARSAPPIPADAPADAPRDLEPAPVAKAQPAPQQPVAPRQPDPEPEPEFARAADAEPEFVGDFDEPYVDPFSDDPFGDEGHDDYLAIDEHEPEPAPHASAEPQPEPHAESGPDWLDPIDDWNSGGAAAAGVPWIDPGLSPRPSAPQPPAPRFEQPAAAPAPIQPQQPAAPTQPPPVVQPPAPRTPSLVLMVDGVPHEITADGAVIGRSRSCDIAIPDASISRRHVELRRDEHGWFAADLGSTNGSTLDGAPLTEARRLAPGQRLTLGHASAVIEVR